MEPIPETVWAIEELGPFAHDGDLLEELIRMGDRALGLVPDLVGLSVESTEHRVTFALLAHPAQRAVFDVLQDHGHTASAAHDPAAHDPASHDPASRGGAAGTASDDLLDEAAWQRRALEHAAPCVLSTLTLPLVKDARIAGCVSLYAASRQAFVGHHGELAEALGAWAAGAVTNADLSFASLREAARAPLLLRSASTIDLAAEIVSCEQHVSVPVARNRIRQAADRAGISETQLAEAVIQLRGP